MNNQFNLMLFALAGGLGLLFAFIVATMYLKKRDETIVVILK